jgi:modulator of FtsH protease HflC
MNRLMNPFVIVGGALFLLLLSGSLFTVKETENAIKLQLGKIERSSYEPGLHFKFPFVESVKRFDKRLLTLDMRPQGVLTSEQKTVIVDSFVKWRIVSPETFYTSLSGIEANAINRISDLLRDALRNAFGNQTLQQVVSENRTDLMGAIQKVVNAQTLALGIEVVDVRIKQVELPENVQDSVYSRMEKERAAIAREIRSEGEETAKIIVAGADRQRAEILASAYSTAEQTRGKGDAQSAQTYAQAFSQDPEFYSMYRSLQAYRSAFSGGNDVMMLQPDSDFFRYFNADPSGVGQ